MNAKKTFLGLLSLSLVISCVVLFLYGKRDIVDDQPGGERLTSSKKDISSEQDEIVLSSISDRREIKPDALAAEQKSREQFLQNIKARRVAQQETIIAGPVLSPDVSGGGYKASDGSFVFSSSFPSNIAETETFSSEADQSTAKPLTFEEELARFRATVPAIKPAHQTAVCLLQ